jgi:hypothetical protein
MNFKSLYYYLFFCSSFYLYTMDASKREIDPENGCIPHLKQQARKTASYCCSPGKRLVFSLLNVTKCGLNVGLVEALNSLEQSNVMDEDAALNEVNSAFNATRAVAWTDFGLSLVQLGGQALSLVRGPESEAPEKIQMCGTACSIIPWLTKLIALSVAKPSFNDSAKASSAWGGIFTLAFFSDPDLAALCCFLLGQTD